MGSFLSTILFTLISTTLSGSILAALFLWLSPKLGKRFQPRAKVLLWNLICLRFLAFMRLSIPLPFIGMRKSQVVISTIEAMPAMAASKPVISQTVSKPDYVLYLICALSSLWFFITAGIFIYRIWKSKQEKYLFFQCSIPVKDEILQNLCSELCREMKIKQKINIRESEYFSSPLVFGIRKAFLLIPEEYGSKEELEMMLRHELAHLKNHDIESRLLHWLVCCLYWFNPIVYMMQKRAEAEIELACDYDILSQKSMDYRSQYQQIVLRSLVKQVEQRTAVNFAGSCSKKEIFYRLSQMTDMTVRKKGRWLVFLMALVVFMACLTYRNFIREDTITLTSLSAPYRFLQGCLINTEVALQCPIENPIETLWPHVYEKSPDKVRHRIVYIAPEEDVPAYAPVEGKIIYVGFWKHEAMGYSVIIQNKHLIVAVGHLKKDAINVSVGEKVERGQQIGLAGMSGMENVVCAEMLVRDSYGNPVDLTGFTSGKCQGMPFKRVTYNLTN